MLNKNEKIVLALIFSLAAGITYLKLSTKNTPLSSTKVEIVPSEDSIIANALSSDSPSQLPTTEKSEMGDSPSDPLNVSQSPESLSAPSAESIALVNQFQIEAKLEIPKELQGMNFKKIPNTGDKDTVGMIGNGALDDTTLAIISRSGPTDLKKIKEYLMDDVADALKIEISKESLEKPEHVQPPAGSGFSSIQVWTVKENGKIAIISLATRSDNNGSYLNIFTGPDQTIEKNEDIYDDILSKFKSK